VLTRGDRTGARGSGALVGIDSDPLDVLARLFGLPQDVFDNEVITVLDEAKVDETLYLVRLDAVSKTSVRLDRHTLNDGVNLWHLDLHLFLRPLTAMKDFVVSW
jgi:hypothetical protein